MLPHDPIALAARISEIQHLVRTPTIDRDRLVDALIAERREEEKIEYANFMADESIPLDERRRFGTPLTHEEIRCLEVGGLDFDKAIPSAEDPVLQGFQRLVDLLIGSLTTEQVAELLDEPPSAIHKLAGNQQLYAVEPKYRLNRFPRFQFTDDGLLPGFHEVAPHIQRDAFLISVENFFRLRNPDLYIDGNMDQTLSPVEWLQSSHDPAAVIECLGYW